MRRRSWGRRSQNRNRPTNPYQLPPLARLAQSRHRAEGGEARLRPPSQGSAPLARRAAAGCQGQRARRPEICPPDPRAILLHFACGALRGPGRPDGCRAGGASRVGGTWGVVQLGGARKPEKSTHKSPQRTSRRHPGAARRDARAACPGQANRARRRPATPTAPAASSIRSTPCAPTGSWRRTIRSSTTSAG